MVGHGAVHARLQKGFQVWMRQHILDWLPAHFVILPETKRSPRRRVDQQEAGRIVKDDDPIFDVLDDRIEFLQFVHTLPE